MSAENFIRFRRSSLPITIIIIDGTSIFNQSNMVKLGIISQKRILSKLWIEYYRRNIIEYHIDRILTYIRLTKGINQPHFKFIVDL